MLASTSFIANDGNDYIFPEYERGVNIGDFGSEAVSASDSDPEDYSGGEDPEVGGFDASSRPERVHDLIEGSFDRLISSIKDTHALTDGSAMSELWNTKVRDDAADDVDDEPDIDFRDELRKASGIGKRKGKGKRRQRNQPVLSVQVRALLSEATTAFINSDLEQVISLLQEVIQIEPRHAQAWDMLSSVHEEMHELDKALQFKIISAHLRHDSEIWHQLGKQSYERGHVQQALYCFQKTCQLDPNNIDALWDRGVLCKTVGNLHGARQVFLALNDKFPEDMAVVLELQGVLRALNDTGLLITIMERAMHLLQLAHPSGHGVASDGYDSPGGGFGESAIAILADFCHEIGEYEKAILVVRNGMRWLQGRLEQRFWDGVLDDREYDAPGMPRVETTGGPVGFPLSLNLRQRLAVSRIKIGDLDEGKAHAAVVLGQDVVQWVVLFREIADTFFQEKMFEDALQVYEKLAENELTSGVDVLMKLGACYRSTGRHAEAAEAYQSLLGAVDSSDTETVKEVKMKLAEIYEMTGELRKALDLVYQVMDARRTARSSRFAAGTAEQEDAEIIAGGSSLFIEEGRSTKKKPTKSSAAARLDAAQLEEAAKQKQTEVDEAWRRLSEHAEELRNGITDAEVIWLAEAEFLVETFRTARELFSVSSKTEPMTTWRKYGRREPEQELAENDLATRLQLELADSKGRRAKHDPDADVSITYRGVSFDEWISLFLNYAFILTRRGQYQLAEEVLKHVSMSKAFGDVTSQDTLRFGRIACAMHERKYDVVVDQCRKFILTYQMYSEPFHVLNACLASGFHQANAFQDSKLQKQLSRETRLMNLVVTGDESSYNVTPQGRFHIKTSEASKKAREEDGDEDGARSGVQVNKPEKETPVPWTVLSQTFLNARSWQSAIFYLMHAYEVEPRDAMVCLSLGITCIGRAMQRQADNRHHMIVQGMAFFSKYRELRRHAHLEEVNYNMGRAFHQLSLFSEALQLYQKVLDSVEKRLTLDPSAELGVARETAYNMSLIYNQTGAVKLSQELYHRWLVL